LATYALGQFFLIGSVPTVFPQLFSLSQWSASRLIRGVTALLVLGLGPTPALAIPEEEAIQKLDAVAVYVLVNGEKQPALYHETDQLVLPMFMDIQQAQEAQRSLNELPDGEVSQVLFLPLNNALDMNEKLTQDLEESSEERPLVTVLVPAEEDWRKAEELLLAEGVSEEKISENLQVPVFFTEPHITVTPPGTEEPKIALFFQYNQLQEAKMNVPDFEGTEGVIDWRAAVKLIIDDEEDRFHFVSTNNRLIEQVREVLGQLRAQEQLLRSRISEVQGQLQALEEEQPLGEQPLEEQQEQAQPGN